MSEHKGKCCGECSWDGVPDKCCCKELEKGYKILANDTEAYRRKSPNHHCGFDFSEGSETATCNCGAVATNPYYMEQPPRTPKELWDEAVAYGKAVEHDMILDRTYDDEIMHELWWVIKREDEFPGPQFIADAIRHFLLIKGETNV